MQISNHRQNQQPQQGAASSARSALKATTRRTTMYYTIRDLQNIIATLCEATGFEGDARQWSVQNFTGSTPDSLAFALHGTCRVNHYAGDCEYGFLVSAGIYRDEDPEQHNGWLTAGATVIPAGDDEIVIYALHISGQPISTLSLNNGNA